MKTAPVKTDIDDGSFSIISLTECQEALSEVNLENKRVFGADSVYLQQLQQVISNGGGGPQLLTQGCVCAYRTASLMGGTFSPRWREQRENLKQLVLRDCLLFF